jgi:hypothetical protein
MDMSEGVCAGCGRELGPRSEWHMVPGGRAYHNGCEPAPEPAPPPPPKPKGLRQRTLDQAAEDELAERRRRKEK